MRVNGYFTVSEFPIIELRRREGYRTATDLDILAFRFPGAGKLVASHRGARTGSEARFAPDPELGVSPQQPDMIIGEVKEGRAVLNAATTDPLPPELPPRALGGPAARGLEGPSPGLPGDPREVRGKRIVTETPHAGPANPLRLRRR